MAPKAGGKGLGKDALELAPVDSRDWTFLDGSLEEDALPGLFDGGAGDLFPGPGMEDIGEHRAPEALVGRGTMTKAFLTLV